MALSVEIAHDFPAFSLDARFEIAGRGAVALFGPSGCGKTTTVLAIAGLLRPRRGRIVLGDRALLDTEASVFVPARRRRVGCVFQDSRLFPHMSVRRNLDYGRRRSVSPPPRGEIDHVIEMLGLGPLLDRWPRTLSGGERQRVALGRTLLSGPELLLLDEPMASLDQPRRAEILPFLERLRDEVRVPIVYVSHSIDEVTRLADLVVVMNAGRVAASGTVSEVTSRLDLFPLTGRFEAGAVFDAEIAGHNEAFHLTELAFPGGRLAVPRVAALPGARLRCRIRARDVTLATGETGTVSAHNALVGSVAEIREDPGPYADVLVDCGGTRLIARVTRASVARLALAPGHRVIALVKAINVETRLKGSA